MYIEGRWLCVHALILVCVSPGSGLQSNNRLSGYICSDGRRECLITCIGALGRLPWSVRRDRHCRLRTASRQEEIRKADAQLGIYSLWPTASYVCDISRLYIHVLKTTNSTLLVPANVTVKGTVREAEKVVGSARSLVIVRARERALRLAVLHLHDARVQAERALSPSAGL